MRLHRFDLLPRFAAVALSGLLAFGLSLPVSMPVQAEPRLQSKANYQLPISAPAGLYSVLWQRFNPPAQKWLTGHRGVDLLAAPGSSVFSPAPGYVSFVGKVGGKSVVTITHPDGLRSTFEPVIGSLKLGSTVYAGTVIGKVDFWPAGIASHCPGSRFGACVHWGVLRGDIYLDPLSMLGKAPPIVLLPS